MFAKKVSSLIKDVAVGVAFLGGEVMGWQFGVKLELFSHCFIFLGLAVVSLKGGVAVGSKFIQGKCCPLIVEWPAWSFFLELQDSSFTAPFLTSNFNLMELLCQEESDSLIKTQLNVEAISSVNI